MEITITEIKPWPRHESVSKKYLVDTRRTPPEDRCLFTKGGEPVISRQDIHLVAARPKAGKSTFCWALVEAAVKGEALGFEAVEGGLRCLIVDTEMSEFDVARKCRSLEKNTDVSIHGRPSDRVQVLRLRRPDKDDSEGAELPIHEWRFQILRDALSVGHYDLLITDGTHDICADVMDNSESVKTSRRLQALAEEYDCAVLSIIHLNPKGNGETRGHLGSQLQRDCADFFRLERRTDATGVQYVHVTHELESRHRQVAPTDFIFGESGEAVPYSPITPASNEAEHLKDELSAIFKGHKEMAG